ncbi:DciA family protein [Chenggangzhangella methanolivorans]|uniref:DciA family protein n=2 Tax=Chenggangzhangella methanolivorans TaxID=1437009 RepID=A0A9E6R7A9_9HYPH|nr:DciA family protein [Chenggangzhangella methanolivorans]
MLKPRPTKRLSDLLPQAMGPAAARQGFAGAEIVSRWAEIVGPELAAVSAPQKLGVPARAPAQDPDAAPPRATLTVRAEGAFALEIQHRSAEILERVNAHLGWPCVGQVKIRQGPVAELRRRKPVPPRPPEPTAEERGRVETATATIEDEGLADALRRLGGAALARSRR